MAKPVLDKDSKAKVKMRRKVRGLRAIERQVLDDRRKAEVVSSQAVAAAEAATASEGTAVSEAVAGADAAVIVTEWPELAGLASAEVREAMANPLIIDGRNLLDPDTVRAAGFEYEGIGRPAPAEETVESV